MIGHHFSVVVMSIYSTYRNVHYKARGAVTQLQEIYLVIEILLILSSENAFSVQFVLHFLKKTAVPLPLHTSP
jgi:hypothetical protein